MVRNWSVVIGGSIVIRPVLSMMSTQAFFLFPDGCVVCLLRRTFLKCMRHVRQSLHSVGPGIPSRILSPARPGIGRHSNGLRGAA